MLVLHYTGMKNAEEALDRMCDPAAKVSAHYMIDEDGSVMRLVPEQMRAWHAGASHWAGSRDVNSRSIGIELVNPGHEFGYRPFAEPLMAALEMLAGDIVARHGIAPPLVVGHSDVAPDRKQDPGELFDWPRLAKAGIGVPVPPAEGAGRDPVILRPGDEGAAVRELQQRLKAWGYGLSLSGHYDETTKTVVRAFQRHFRPSGCDGVADGPTRRVLAELLLAHMPDGL